MTLAGPTLPPFGSAPTNWMLGPGVGAWTPPSDLAAIAAKLVTAPPSGAPGGVVTPGVLGEMAYGLNLPPLLQGVAGPTQPGGFTAPNTATPAYGYGLAFGRSVWLGLQGPGMSPLLTANTGQHPWGWLSQFQPALWSKLNRAFTDALARARAGGSPSALCSQLAFQAGAGASGATVTGDGWAQLGEAIDYAFGFLDGLTAGLFGRALAELQLGGMADTSSSAYQFSREVGQVTAGVALLVLPILAPELMPLIMAVQALSFGWSAAEAFQKGDWKTGVFDVGMGLLSLTGAGEALEGAEVAGLAAGEAEAPAAAETAAEAIPAGVGEAPAAGLGAEEGGAGAALQPEQEGMPPTAEAPTENPDPTAAECQRPGECFTAETLLWTRLGLKPVLMFRAGDRLLSRPDGDPDAPVQERLVQAVFVRTAPVWELRLGGRVVRTTASHPFWVRGKGRRTTARLEAGDELAGKDGEWTAVEAVTDTGRVETVYNVTVAEYHTYFVGGDGWDFAVWAHDYEGGGTPAEPGEPDWTAKFDENGVLRGFEDENGQGIPTKDAWDQYVDYLREPGHRDAMVGSFEEAQQMAQDVLGPEAKYVDTYTPNDGESQWSIHPPDNQVGEPHIRFYNTSTGTSGHIYFTHW